MYRVARKELTRDEVAARQAKAVRFVEDVVGDADLADEIADLSTDEYAARKGFTIVNPLIKGGRKSMATKRELQERVEELEDELEDAQEDLEQAETALAEIADKADSALEEEAEGEDTQGEK